MPPKTHEELAAGLRARLGAPAGRLSPELRLAAATRAVGGPPIPQPYDELAEQIGKASARVTDAQVRAVREAAGSDKAAFEVVMSAAIGTGLMRFDAALRALQEAADAAP